MIRNISNFNIKLNSVDRKIVSLPNFKGEQDIHETDYITVYGDNPIRTNPAQLSLFHMHDFHGQNIRMERAYNAIKQFDNGHLTNQNDIFDKNVPIDKLKLCSGDMFLGENLDELSVVNEFLNISGVLANTIGNHECDTFIDLFNDKVSNRSYKFLGANIHPDKNSNMNNVLSKSFIAEVHGNKYGIIGLSPIDIEKHLKRPNEAKPLNVQNMEGTVKDLQHDINNMKKQGVNKIIVLSHLGLANEIYLAENVNDIDIILGGHTHDLLTEVKEGENLFYSPKGEPVLIMQVGRDGEYMGIPNIKFNESGQITGIQYNVLKTDDFSRSVIAKNAFEKILGKPEVVGKIKYVEEPPKDIYANENSNCDFIVDCMKYELGTDIAIMNSANIRGKFVKGDIDTRALRLISPFANNVIVINASEKELVDSIKKRTKTTITSSNHRPGLLQVSGLRYTFDKSSGELLSLSFVEDDGKERKIDIENPREDKFYTVATDDFCGASESGGLNLKHRVDEALVRLNYDKDVIVADYLKKQTEPVVIVSDGRIQAV